MYYEYACGYVYYLNRIDDLTASNEMTPDILEAMRNQVKLFAEKKDQVVCKKHDITSIFLEEWITKERNDM